MTDIQTLITSFNKTAAHFDKTNFLFNEIGDRLLEQLFLTRIKPKIILDLGCGTGNTTEKLRKLYPKAKIIGLDAAINMSIKTRMQRKWFHKIPTICALAQQIPLPDSSVDLVFSNLMLPWNNPLSTIFEEIARILAPNGALFFSSLGPNTLLELKQSWQLVDNFTHVHEFEDMHNIGDILQKNRLIDPVIHTESLFITYPSVYELMRDLKNTGTHKLLKNAYPALMGKKRFAKFIDTYEKFREEKFNSRLPASFEVIYGHAWGNVQGFKANNNQPQEVLIPIASLKNKK